MSNGFDGYLDVHVSLQQDTEQFESHLQEELEEMEHQPVDIEYEPVEYTASFLATSDNPRSLPGEVLKSSIWIGVKDENPDFEPSADDHSPGPTLIGGSVEKYPSQAVPSVSNFEDYISILENLRNETVAQNMETSYFVAAQARNSGLSDTLRDLEESGITGLKTELPNGEESWQVYQEHAGAGILREVPSISAKYDSELNEFSV